MKIVQKEVADILNDRILVGHAIHNDLKVSDVSWKKDLREMMQFSCEI